MSKRRGGQFHAQLDGPDCWKVAAGKAIEKLCSKLHGRNMEARWHVMPALVKFYFPGPKPPDRTLPWLRSGQGARSCHVRARCHKSPPPLRAGRRRATSPLLLARLAYIRVGPVIARRVLGVPSAFAVLKFYVFGLAGQRLLGGSLLGSCLRCGFGGKSL